MKNLIIDETGNNLKYNNDRIRNLANFEKFLSKNDLRPNSVIVSLFCFLYEMSQKMNVDLINDDKKIFFAFSNKILA
jgi:hypothetical protein